jgi:UDP:flavonoid glycosyltransferase YjiC (YdhE family)
VTRVLVATTPMISHVRPVIPVMRELTAAGCEVLWYTGKEFAPLAAGVDFAPSTVEWSQDSSIRRKLGPGGPSTLATLVLEMLLRPIPAFVADLVGVFDRFGPDVVVSDSTFRAALFEAERRDIPRIALSVAPLNLSSADTAPFGTGLPPPSSLPGRLRNHWRYWWLHHVTGRVLQEEAQRIRANLGLPELGGYFIDWVARICDRYLVATIPEFEYPRSDLPPSVRYVGLLEDRAEEGWDQPPWWPDLHAARDRGRPVIFLTQGTVTTDPAHLLLPAASALANDDCLVIASTSGRQPDDLIPASSRPANLRLAPFVPYTAILPHADLMITNGGCNGVQLALSAGVPLVVAGNTEDKHEVGMRVRHAGCGVSLATSQPGQDRLAAAAHEVLTGPAYRDNARRLKAAYARYPGAPMAAACVQEVAGARSRGEGLR